MVNRIVYSERVTDKRNNFKRMSRSGYKRVTMKIRRGKFVKRELEFYIWFESEWRAGLYFLRPKTIRLIQLQRPPANQLRLKVNNIKLMIEKVT